MKEIYFLTAPFHCNEISSLSKFVLINEEKNTFNFAWREAFLPRIVALDFKLSLSLLFDEIFCCGCVHMICFGETTDNHT